MKTMDRIAICILIGGITGCTITNIFTNKLTYLLLGCLTGTIIYIYLEFKNNKT